MFVFFQMIYNEKALIHGENNFGEDSNGNIIS